MPLSEFNKHIWFWLFSEGGYWTAEEVARRIGYEPQKVFRGLQAMCRNGTVAKQRTTGTHKYSYGVDGTCLVPKGMRLAEVQIDQ